MSWFEKLLPSIRTKKNKTDIPEGVWCKCENCQAILFKSELEKNLFVCPKCQHHMRLTARMRLNFFLDPEGQVELAADLAPVDSLRFRDTKRYRDRLTAAQRTTGEQDALIVIAGSLQNLPIVAAAFEFKFIGGSMGTVVGEKFVQAIEYAIAHQAPLVCFATSGGARMQESLLSLMQMAKTSAALAKLAENRLPYISVMVDPCMGGVSASLAMLGDINLAEPKALIGFAGPKVIEQTLRETLPEGFQRSEFLLSQGALDRIVPRAEMRAQVYSMLCKLMGLPQ